MTETAGSENRWKDRLGAVKDIMAVKRALGESYVLDGTTLIPVAAVWGGGGGGRDTGSQESAGHQNSGGGFGARVRPIGVIAINDGKDTWRPTIDVLRIVQGGQLLVLAVLLAIGLRARNHSHDRQQEP